MYGSVQVPVLCPSTVLFGVRFRPLVQNVRSDMHLGGPLLHG